ncbi:putative reverse transcriptase domain-containing protein [Tanacetum coccineum]
MAPKRTTKAKPADTTTTTSLTNGQLKAMIDQGVTDALAARDADRNTNDDDSHNSGIGSGEKKPYGGSKHLCPKCNYHHDGPCAPKCHKCNRVGHLARDCRVLQILMLEQHLGALGQVMKPTCYDVESLGRIIKRDCPKLKNNNRGNQGGNGNALAKVYAIGRVGTNPDSNVVTNLMPVELGSLDVIISKDWLAKYQAVIVCAEKIVQVQCLKDVRNLLASMCTYTKDTEDKSEKKRLEDVPIVQNFPEVFPEDLSGLPPYIAKYRIAKSI